MPTSVLSISDGPRTTVADLVGNPMLIPARVLELLRNAFVAEALLRDAGPNTNGLVRYDESTPLYLGTDIEDVAEFSEIPVGAGQRGTPAIAYATKKALGVRISREMRDENKLDDVNRQLKQLVNTFIRADDRVLKALLQSAAVPTMPASAAWDTANSKPRKDFADAMYEVSAATPTATQGDDGFGFKPDTIVLHPSLVPILTDNEDFLKVYKDALASESIAYTGALPKQIMGMDPLTAWSWPMDRVFIGERKTIGFYSDTRALESTGLYPEGGGPNGGPTESWRSDTSRKRAMALDEPKAGIWITGVVTP
ncbi:hypothetical protein [Nocardia sp. NPDC057455]|uniref:phage major capsid protein n=1 Tax=Nocardia sp. NPDC057455 TaxID=3346138 RepID=UPI00366D7C12